MRGNFFYVYILRSAIDDKCFYTGVTVELRERIAAHNNSRVRHTSKSRPWILKTYIAFRDRTRAGDFERYLKSASGGICEEAPLNLAGKFHFRFSIGDLRVSALCKTTLACRPENDRDRDLKHFTDADCYARMTRARLCSQQPGLVLRHHHFENYPTGTTPHTTTPLDYLILALSLLLKPFTSHSIDLAGAAISPLFALIGGWFLWWWSRVMKSRYRWTMLILYAISPILVHGTELGRPDHQSLLMLLVTIGLCAEWSWQSEQSVAWGVLGASSWAFGLWVQPTNRWRSCSFYS